LFTFCDYIPIINHIREQASKYLLHSLPPFPQSTPPALLLLHRAPLLNQHHRHCPILPPPHQLPPLLLRLFCYSRGCHTQQATYNPNTATRPRLPLPYIKQPFVEAWNWQNPSNDLEPFFSCWNCFSYDSYLYNQNKCLYAIFIMFGDVSNFEFELDHTEVILN